MAKANRQSEASKKPQSAKDGGASKKSSARNLAETIVILVILVVLLRGFLLESFRIPSSSMEPTLIGNPYFGDRVLAWKPALSLGSPDRWSIDVFVKHPDRRELQRGETASRNFIKRVIGLPGERVIICGGDIYVETAAEAMGKIARKPDDVQEKVWHPVYESDGSWSPTWKLSGGMKAEDGSGALVTDGAKEAAAKFARNHYDSDEGVITNLYIRDTRSRIICPSCSTVAKIVIKTSKTRVKCPGAGCDETLDILTELLYSPDEEQHNCPSCDSMLDPGSDVYSTGRCPECEERVDQLVRSVFNVPGRYPDSYGNERPVADVRVSYDAACNRASGSIVTRISVDDRTYGCTIDLADARAILSGPHGVEGVAPLGISTAGSRFRVSFAHIDHAVELRIDGRRVVRHEYELNWRKCAGGPKRNSVEIVCRDAAVELSSPKIERDLHYLARGNPKWVEFYFATGSRAGFASPSTEDDDDSDVVIDADAVRTRTLSPTQYLMMGDNSPSSYDGRNWGPVDRTDMVGKAVVLFWPPSRCGLVD